jgi:hypothetical protein
VADGSATRVDASSQATVGSDAACPRTQCDAATTFCPDCVSFQVSAPVVVPLPPASHPNVPDNLFATVAFPDHIVGYTADQYTYELSGSTLANLNSGVGPLDDSPVIGPGTAGEFDECGAWIHGADLGADGKTVTGWYHAESGYCHGETAATERPVKTIAFSVSTDRGLTFQKPSYPKNIVLAASPAQIAMASASLTEGNGDFSVVRLGDWYYMFFGDASNGHMGVARADVHGGGAPGTWSKWYLGAFTEPGVGGQSSDIGPLLAGVSYNTAIGRFVGLTYQSSLGDGFRVAFSPEGTSWTVVDAPLVPTGTRWSDTASGWIQYQTIVAPDGTRSWTDAFQLYYMFDRPTFASRRLLTSRVTMVIASTPVVGPKVSVDLLRYYSPSAGKHRVTSAVPLPLSGSGDFAPEARLGSVFTRGGDGLLELDDCFYGTTGYVVSPGGACDTTSMTKMDVIGWAYSPASPQPPGTRAIYRCYVATADDHFVSLDPQCEGGGSKVEALLGYVRP